MERIALISYRCLSMLFACSMLFIGVIVNSYGQSGSGERPSAQPITKQPSKMNRSSKKRTTSSTRSRATSTKADPISDDISYWESIKDSTNPEDFKAYLRKYPDGKFASLARQRAMISINGNGDSLEIISFDPPLPAYLSNPDKHNGITVKIAYKLKSAESCRIFVRVLNDNDVLHPDMFTDPSPVHPRGDGIVTRSFGLLRAGDINQIEITMNSPDWEQTFLSMRVNIKARWSN